MKPLPGNSLEEVLMKYREDNYRNNPGKLFRSVTAFLFYILLLFVISIVAERL